MLVLSRRRGERLVIGKDVVVTVLATSGGRVTLGVVAPAEVPVHREEIQQRIEDCPPSFRLAECA
jgi:carbon storage regulator